MTKSEEIAVGAESVAARTRESLGVFTAGERKVARALLANYPVAGLETAAQLAARAKVSPPTVIRFVARLGFGGYPAFQQALMHEVDESIGSPLKQYAQKRGAHAGREFLPYAASAYVGALDATFAELPEAEFTRAVELICDSRRAVHLLGGRFSRVLAEYLTSHLWLLRAGVAGVPDDELGRLALLADAGKTDLLIAFDYRRYDQLNVRFATLMAERGATVVLLTDRWLSPAAEVADVVLPAGVEAPSPFDSLVPALAVVETLVATVTDRLGDEGRRRLEMVEASRERWQRRPGPEGKTP
jgi:DNA-binding MurR/RpiR family transcriptional regulator